MDHQETWRQYLLVDRVQADELIKKLTVIDATDPDLLSLRNELAQRWRVPEDFEILRRSAWAASVPADLGDTAPNLTTAESELISVPLEFYSTSSVLQFIKAFEARGLVDRRSFLEISPDLAIGSADYCCPTDSTGFMMGRRADARRLIGMNRLTSALTPEQLKAIDGHGVNVVLVDQGIDQTCIPHGQFGGGWNVVGSPFKAGETPPQYARHSTMLARNILDLAPKTRFFDLPLIQKPKYGDLVAFISLARDALWNAERQIKHWQSTGKFSGPWIFVNAWAPFDLRREIPKGKYSNDPSNNFYALVNSIVDVDIDFVFCAGNCGPVCPDGRCGPNDIGPGRSVLGAASYERVLSVGAVRVDAMLIGYSSQGPGQSMLFHEKPDLCAPSGFTEDSDMFTTSSGTSAACAVAAGVVAALRTRWPSTAVSPDQLRRILNATAGPAPGAQWNQQTGHGIIDIAAAYQALSKL